MITNTTRWNADDYQEDREREREKRKCGCVGGRTRGGEGGWSGEGSSQTRPTAPLAYTSPFVSLPF